MQATATETHGNVTQVVDWNGGLDVVEVVVGGMRMWDRQRMQLACKKQVGRSSSSLAENAYGMEIREYLRRTLPVGDWTVLMKPDTQAMKGDLMVVVETTGERRKYVIDLVAYASEEELWERAERLEFEDIGGLEASQGWMVHFALEEREAPEAGTATNRHAWPHTCPTVRMLHVQHDVQWTRARVWWSPGRWEEVVL
jgi:hypothetical protein